MPRPDPPWTSDNFEREAGLGLGPPSVSWVPSRHVASGLTVEDRPAVLRGRGQRQAGVIELVAIVPDADLKLNGVVHVLQHGRRVEGSEERVFAPSEVLLEAEGAARAS